VRGVIRSSWKRDGERVDMQVTLPPNVTATVYVPREGGATTYEVVSGTHQFTGTQRAR
jgi:hypothetical protein